MGRAVLVVMLIQERYCVLFEGWGTKVSSGQYFNDFVYYEALIATIRVLFFRPFIEGTELPFYVDDLDLTDSDLVGSLIAVWFGIKSLNAI